MDGDEWCRLELELVLALVGSPRDTRRRSGPGSRRGRWGGPSRRPARGPDDATVTRPCCSIRRSPGALTATTLANGDPRVVVGARRLSGRVRTCPSESRAVQVKTPFAMVDVAASRQPGEDLGAGPVDRRVRRRGQGRQLGQMGRQPQRRDAPRSAPCRRAGPPARARARSARTPAPPARAASSPARAASGAGLSDGRVPVPPAAVQAPDVAHHELGLVVDRPEVGTVGEVGGHRHGVEDLVEPGPGVHEREGLVDEGVEQIGGVGERLADSRPRPRTGKPWPGSRTSGSRLIISRRATAHSRG